MDDRTMTQDPVDRELEGFRKWVFYKFRDASLIDLWGVLTGTLLVIVGAIAAGIYYGQLAEMRHTNDLTQQALNSSGDTLSQTLGKMQGQIDATNRLYGEAQKQTGLTTRLANQSVKSADAATKSANAAAASTEILRWSDRPWITIDHIEPVYAWRSQTAVDLKFRLRNTGQYTALRVAAAFEIRHEPTIGLGSPMLTDVCQEASNKLAAPDVVGNVTSVFPGDIGVVEQRGYAGVVGAGAENLVGCILYLGNPNQREPYSTKVIYNDNRGSVTTQGASIHR